MPLMQTQILIFKDWLTEKKDFQWIALIPKINCNKIFYFNKYKRLKSVTKYISCLTHQLFTKQ